VTEPAIEAGRLPRLTSLRAFAALAVFGYHLGHDLGIGPMNVLLGNGYAGVAFFFVLSGFVLTWSWRPGTAAKDFWLRRFARIWPSHAVMTGIALGLVGVVGRQWIVALLGVQAWSTSPPVVFAANSPSWSLSCEFFFYACLPLLLPLLLRLNHRHRLVLAGAWWLATNTFVTVATFVGGVPALVAYVDPAVRSGEFVVGVVLALHVKEHGWPVPLPIAVIATFAAVAATHPAQIPLPDVALAPFFVALIGAAAVADVRRRSGWLTSRRLVSAGEVSFAFYLVHELSLLELRYRGHFSPGTAALLAVPTAVAAAVALHHVVELPAQRAILRTAGSRQVPVRRGRSRQPDGSTRSGAAP
jgi:peptidoglycan/LPS O-acetylase OafA/YrhL